jgi:hypothetical protein
MSKPTIRIHNSQTDEIIDREMNDDEYANYLDLIQKEKEAVEAESAFLAKKAEAEAKLVALGLDPDDLRALGL